MNTLDFRKHHTLSGIQTVVKDEMSVRDVNESPLFGKVV